MALRLKTLLSSRGIRSKKTLHAKHKVNGSRTPKNQYVMPSGTSPHHSLRNIFGSSLDSNAGVKTVALRALINLLAASRVLKLKPPTQNLPASSLMSLLPFVSTLIVFSILFCPAAQRYGGAATVNLRHFKMESLSYNVKAICPTCQD